VAACAGSPVPPGLLPAICSVLSVPGGDGAAPLGSCQVSLPSQRGAPKQKAVSASVGQKPLMRQREGVLRSWLMAGWVLFQMLMLLCCSAFYLSSNVYLFSKCDSVCSKYWWLFLDAYFCWSRSWHQTLPSFPVCNLGRAAEILPRGLGPAPGSPQRRRLRAGGTRVGGDGMWRCC